MLTCAEYACQAQRLGGAAEAVPEIRAPRVLRSQGHHTQSVSPLVPPTPRKLHFHRTEQPTAPKGAAPRLFWSRATCVPSSPGPRLAAGMWTENIASNVRAERVTRAPKIAEVRSAPQVVDAATIGCSGLGLPPSPSRASIWGLLRPRNFVGVAFSFGCTFASHMCFFRSAAFCLPPALPERQVRGVAAPPRCSTGCRRRLPGGRRVPSGTRRYLGPPTSLDQELGLRWYL